MAKTTLEIADGLLVKAKKLAAELHEPVRSVVEKALRQYLRQGAGRSNQHTARHIRWKTVAGGLPKGLKIDSRINLYNWIRQQKNDRD